MRQAASDTTPVESFHRGGQVGPDLRAGRYDEANNSRKELGMAQTNAAGDVVGADPRAARRGPS